MPGLCQHQSSLYASKFPAWSRCWQDAGNQTKPNDGDQMPDYLQPQTLDAAIEALRRDPGLRIIAGGTDVYPSLGGAVARTPLLDLTGIADLKGVTFGADEILIGALASWTDVQRAGLPPAFQALVQAGR